MEGLQIAAVLRRLKTPQATHGWRFPDEGTASLVLEGGVELVMQYKPPQPSISLSNKGSGGGPPRTPFQKQLAARVRGALTRVEQLKLDRVVFFEFGGESGFVDAPATRLIVELTGRNANIIICDNKGLILGADRLIGGDVNRYREVKPGIPWRPPPPYDKLDPRKIRDPSELGGLLGKPLLRALVKQIDGIGPNLARETAKRASLDAQRIVNEADLPAIYHALLALVENPESEISGRSWREESRETLQKPLLAALDKRLKTLRRRLGDLEKARDEADRAEYWRHLGDLVLAYAHQLKPGTERVTLPDWQGGEMTLDLNPALDAPGNAERFYRRARRARKRAARADREEPLLRREINELQKEIAAVKEADLPLLRRLSKELRKGAKPPPGIRLSAPGGFEVWVGRNDKENELLTRSARSQDVWLHVQGLPGSHVIIRSGGKPVPLDTLLYAARWAAYYSKARGEKNVAVDYTLKKYVWRPRKAAAGQVLYTRAKTLFVDGVRPEGPRRE